MFSRVSRLIGNPSAKIRAQRALARELRLPPPTPTNSPEIDDTTECSVPIASDTVASLKAKLGLIDTCFAENPSPAYQEIVCFSESYKRLGTKEELVLLFVENFRWQYKERFLHRKPLMHALPNECGVQKFVYTSLKPSVFGSWEEIASFVADYIVYEPLLDQINMATNQAEQCIGS